MLALTRLIRHGLNIIIAIPSIIALVFLMARFCMSCVRTSTQLGVHCWAWIFYFVSGFGYSLYALIRFYGDDYVYNEPVFQRITTFYLCFAVLLPWALLFATVDRCISLRFPTYYAVFNGGNMRMITISLCTFSICGVWAYLYRLLVRAGSDAPCHTIECSGIDKFLYLFMIYKTVFGVVNLILISIFLYLFLNYQRRRKDLDNVKNKLIFIILIAEFSFNVLPPLAFWIISSFVEMTLTSVFSTLMFVCINMDGICTVLIYIITYKRKQKQFHLCKPRQFTLKENEPMNHISAVSYTAKIGARRPFVTVRGLNPSPATR